ncbi:MAG: hypothetical protein ACR2F8_12540 [Caulobacteraceae bacterium]
MMPLRNLFVGMMGAGLMLGTQPALAKTPVEFWHVGDDGLSERLADAIEAAIAASPDFELSPSGAGIIKIEIPTNVSWKKVGNRERVDFQIQTTRRGQSTISDVGECPEDNLQLCAKTVLKKTRHVMISAARSGVSKP